MSIETPKGWKRSELKGGYYILIAPPCDPRDPADVMLFDKNDNNLQVAFAPDTPSNEARIIEGVARKIVGVREHLADLEAAFKVLLSS